MRAGRHEAAARSPGGGARGFGGAEGAARRAAAPRAECPGASGLGGGDALGEGGRKASGSRTRKASARLSEAMRGGGSRAGSAVGRP